MLFRSSLTICMQAMAPTRSDITCRSHGIDEANKNSKFGHSLEVQREIIYHDGCFPKATNLGLTFSHVKVTHVANMCWEYHLPHSNLLKTRSALHWYLMWDCKPPPQVQISVCIYVILLPYIDDILVLFMGLYGQKWVVYMYHMGWNFILYFMIHVLVMTLLHPCLFLLSFTLLKG